MLTRRSALTAPLALAPLLTLAACGPNAPADDALSRHLEDVLFGRIDPVAASEALVEEGNGLLA